jgi:uncharacterized membrane-anchored protein YjiN (DUF445 family)
LAHEKGLLKTKFNFLEKFFSILWLFVFTYSLNSFAQNPEDCWKSIAGQNARKLTDKGLEKIREHNINSSRDYTLVPVMDYNESEEVRAKKILNFYNDLFITTYTLPPEAQKDRLDYSESKRKLSIHAKLKSYIENPKEIENLSESEKKYLNKLSEFVYEMGQRQRYDEEPFDETKFKDNLRKKLTERFKGSEYIQLIEYYLKLSVDDNELKNKVSEDLKSKDPHRKKYATAIFDASNQFFTEAQERKNKDLHSVAKRIAKMSNVLREYQGNDPKKRRAMCKETGANSQHVFSEVKNNFITTPAEYFQQKDKEQEPIVQTKTLRSGEEVKNIYFSPEDQEFFENLDERYYGQENSINSKSLEEKRAQEEQNDCEEKLEKEIQRLTADNAKKNFSLMIELLDLKFLLYLKNNQDAKNARDDIEKIIRQSLNSGTEKSIEEIIQSRYNNNGEIIDAFAKDLGELNKKHQISLSAENLVQNTFRKDGNFQQNARNYAYSKALLIAVEECRESYADPAEQKMYCPGETELATQGILLRAKNGLNEKQRNDPMIANPFNLDWRVNHYLGVQEIENKEKFTKEKVKQLIENKQKVYDDLNRYIYSQAVNNLDECRKQLKNKSCDSRQSFPEIESFLDKTQKLRVNHLPVIDKDNYFKKTNIPEELTQKYFENNTNGEGCNPKKYDSLELLKSDVAKDNSFKSDYTRDLLAIADIFTTRDVQVPTGQNSPLSIKNPIASHLELQNIMSKMVNMKKVAESVTAKKIQQIGDIASEAIQLLISSKKKPKIEVSISGITFDSLFFKTCCSDNKGYPLILNSYTWKGITASIVFEYTLYELAEAALSKMSGIGILKPLLDKAVKSTLSKFKSRKKFTVESAKDLKEKKDAEADNTALFKFNLNLSAMATEKMEKNDRICPYKKLEVKCTNKASLSSKVKVKVGRLVNFENTFDVRITADILTCDFENQTIGLNSKADIAGGISDSLIFEGLILDKIPGLGLIKDNKIEFNFDSDKLQQND